MYSNLDLWTFYYTSQQRMRAAEHNRLIREVEQANRLNRTREPRRFSIILQTVLNAARRRSVGSMREAAG